MKNLRQKYIKAVQKAFSPKAARARFPEYDEFRARFCSEIHAWLYGENPKQVYSLSQLAWKVTQEINEGGRCIRCMNFSDKNQRFYLGDGLLEYLGLLKDEVEIQYGKN